LETLKTESHVQNRTLKQIKRQGSVALYELYGPRGQLYGFEVVVIRVRRTEELFGRWYPERETYPGNEDWGTYGWSYLKSDLAGAQKRFDSLLLKWASDVCANAILPVLPPSPGS
jgi:hypothetical protein